MKHKVVWNSKIKCFSSNVLYQIGASDVENVKEKLTTGIKFKVAFYGKYTNIFTNDVIPKHINVKKISKTLFLMSDHQFFCIMFKRRHYHQM